MADGEKSWLELRLGDQAITDDRDTTAHIYRSIEKGSADECGCADCQNFAAQRAAIYPEPFRQLLAELGIDPLKEGEVYAIGSIERDKLSYGGWFYFTGEMIAAGERNTDLNGFEYWINALCPAAAFRGEPVLTVEFLTTLDWILAVPRTPVQHRSAH